MSSLRERLQQLQEQVPEWKKTGIGWIPCEVSPGVFPNEYAITILSDGEYFNTLVYRGLVLTEKVPSEGEVVEGLLRVRIAREIGDKVQIFIPGDALQTSSLVIPQSMLEE